MVRCGASSPVCSERTGAHEVITTIMLNLIALRLVEYFLKTTLFQAEGRPDPVSSDVLPSAQMPELLGFLNRVDLRVHLGIVIAVLAAYGVYWLLFKSTIGFEYRALGLNPHGARYAGMSVTWLYVSVMAVAGALAGLAGADRILGVLTRATPGFAGAVGFDAIALALVGRSHPAGVVAAGLLFGGLRRWSGDAGAHRHLTRPHPGDPGARRRVHRRPCVDPGDLPGAHRRGRHRAVEDGMGLGMTALAADLKIRTPAEMRRSRRLGIVYIVLALFVLWVFGFGSAGDGDSTFRLARPTDRIQDLFGWDLSLVLPAAMVSYVIATMLGFFGTIQLTRGFRRLDHVILSIALMLVVFAFLTWAAAGKSFSLSGMLDETVKRSVPIALGALAGVMSERVAVVNIAIEGMLMGGAFVAARDWVVVRIVLGDRGGDAHRRCAGVGARSAGDPVPGRSDHRRGGDQHLRVGPHLVHHRTGAVAEPSPQRSRRPEADQAAAPRRSADRRAHPLRAQHLRVRDVHPRGGDRLHAVPHQVGTAVPGGGGSTPRQPTPSGSTSTAIAT